LEIKKCVNLSKFKRHEGGGKGQKYRGGKRDNNELGDAF